MSTAVQLALVINAIGCGIMAGVYFSFSAFVMKALDAIPKPQAVAAMQSINHVILSSAFMPVFLGTSALSLVLAACSFARWGQPGAWTWLLGGGIYLFGMFACTAVFNVPLNDALAAVASDSPEAASLWTRYFQQWTWWNHVRTVCSAVACGVFIGALYIYR